jgi:hypothetical protein
MQYELLTYEIGRQWEKVTIYWVVVVKYKINDGQKIISQ